MAFKNRSFARGFQVDMESIRSISCGLTSQCEKWRRPARGKMRAGQLFRQLAEQPCPAERPEAVCGSAADAQDVCGLLVREAGEVA